MSRVPSPQPDTIVDLRTSDGMRYQVAVLDLDRDGPFAALALDLNRLEADLEADARWKHMSRTDRAALREVVLKQRDNAVRALVATYQKASLTSGQTEIQMLERVSKVGAWISALKTIVSYDGESAYVKTHIMSRSGDVDGFYLDGEYEHGNRSMDTYYDGRRMMLGCYRFVIRSSIESSLSQRVCLNEDPSEILLP